MSDPALDSTVGELRADDSAPPPDDRVDDHRAPDAEPPDDRVDDHRAPDAEPPGDRVDDHRAPDAEPPNDRAEPQDEPLAMLDERFGPPDVPPGRFIELDDRGTLIVRDFGRADGCPLLLLHGWTATADLNWFRCYDALAEHYRVVAYDHRGHGAGLRSKKRFRLEDCADDAVAVADALGIERFVPVGYSMGGPIAQLVWRRHPERVAGLVLCATAPAFVGERAERRAFLGITGLAALARVTPEQARDWLTEQVYLQRKSAEWEPWAIQEASSHDWRMLLEAGNAIGTFSSVDWIGDVDVPVSLVLTMRDRIVRPERQIRLFELVEHARPFRVDGDHDAVVAEADRFVPSLMRAVAEVDA